MGNATTLVRITAETNKYEQNIKKAQKTFNDFTRSMGVDMKKLSGIGLALGAVTTAVKVAGDAFKANERAIDEWGRAVRGASSAYDGFLTAINTGDISGYLKRIDRIVSAARTAYDELDKLSTQQAINSPAKTAQQMENQRIQSILRTGREIKGINGEGLAGVNEGTLLNKAQLEAYAKQLEDGLSKYNGIIRAEIEQSTVAIEALYEEQAAILGMSKEEFKAGVSDFDTFERKMSLAKKYREFEAAHTSSIVVQSSAGAASMSQRDSAVNPFADYRAWSVFLDDGKLYKEIIQKIQERAGLQSQLLGGMAQSYRQINRAGGINPYAGGGSSSSAKNVTLPQLQMAGLGSGSVGTLAEALTIPDAVIEQNEEFFEKNFIRMKNLVDEAARMSETWNLVAGSISTVGGALAGLEDPTARIIGTVMQAVATLALSYAEAAAKASKLGPIAWTAFAATGLDTFIGAASTIKNTTKGGFADGGIIPGNYYGDQLSTANYGISSGELILNKAQQSNLASILNNGAGRMNLTATVSGEQIRFVLNNYGRRTGRGEYVTTKFN